MPASAPRRRAVPRRRPRRSSAQTRACRRARPRYDPPQVSRRMPDGSAACARRTAHVELRTVPAPLSASAAGRTDPLAGQDRQQEIVVDPTTRSHAPARPAGAPRRPPRAGQVANLGCAASCRATAIAAMVCSLRTALRPEARRSIACACSAGHARRRRAPRRFLCVVRADRVGVSEPAPTVHAAGDQPQPHVPHRAPDHAHLARHLAKPAKSIAPADRRTAAPGWTAVRSRGASVAPRVEVDDARYRAARRRAPPEPLPRHRSTPGHVRCPTAASTCPSRCFRPVPGRRHRRRGFAGRPTAAGRWRGRPRRAPAPAGRGASSVDDDRVALIVTPAR